MSSVPEGLEHLRSPVHLARAFRGETWQTPAHVKAMNEALLQHAREEGSWTMINAPFQHSKSETCSRAYPAWRLLTDPDRRIMLVAHEEDFAINEFGAVVKEIVGKFGPDLGVRLSADTKSKGEWKVEGRLGGMVCRGPAGGITGRPVDEFIIDDLVRDHAQALSQAISDSHWEWYKTVVFGRLRRRTNLLVVGTRWSRRDLCGRLLERATRTRRKWRLVKFKAIAEEGDPLGRRPGEALWPDQVTLEHLQEARQESGRWWRACWQQEPDAEEGQYFYPEKWPRWRDIGGHYSVEREGKARRIYDAEDCTRIVTADWAWGEKTTSDYTAIGVFDLTPGGDLLILEVVNRRLRLEEFAPEMAAVCRRWRPHVCAVEDGHPTFKRECSKYGEIPEVRWLKPAGKQKLVRAVPAMNKEAAGYRDDVGKGEGGIVLPAAEQHWRRAFVNQVAGFTGIDDEHDDMVDCLAWACHVAQWYGPLQRDYEDGGPVMLTGPLGPWQ